MKTILPILALATGLATLALAQTAPPSGNSGGAAPVAPHITPDNGKQNQTIPSANNNQLNRTIPPANNNQGNQTLPPENNLGTSPNNVGTPPITSPNDDQINQLTPEITNYTGNNQLMGTNGYNQKNRRYGYNFGTNNYHGTNWNAGGYDRTNGYRQFGNSNYWSNGSNFGSGYSRTNWPNGSTNRNPGWPH